MYKTVSVHNHTYQQLNAIATKLDKPKAQIIADLIEQYSQINHQNSEKELQTFNNTVVGLQKRLKLPKNTKIDTQNLDQDFKVLQNTEF